MVGDTLQQPGAEVFVRLQYTLHPNTFIKNTTAGVTVYKTNNRTERRSNGTHLSSPVEQTMDGSASKVVRFSATLVVQSHATIVR